MNIIDTHCHLDVEEFDADRDQVMARCMEMGVSQLVVPAIHFDNWQRVVDLGRADQRIRPALGLHPVYINDHRPVHLQQLEDWLRRYRPVAIGEIGLDYYIKGLDSSEQREYFVGQLEIARTYQLPVILHVRKAHDAVLKILKRIRPMGGIAHAFNGSQQQAKQYMDLGFKLGFGGTLTYENANKIHKLARELPLECMVLETDAPDMVVASHRGERNSPEYLPLCLEALAKIRNMDKHVIAEATTNNARSVLNL